MVDAGKLILSELDRFAAAAEPPAPNWRDVVARAGSTRSRLPRALVLTFAAALVIGPTLAFSAGVRQFLGLSTIPRPVLAKAVLQVSASAPHGQVVRVFVAPSDTGGTCEFTDIVPAGAAGRAVGGGGGACAARRGPLHPKTSAAPLTWSMSMGRKPTGPRLATWVPAVFSGWVNPQLQAARVELVWRRGHLRLGSKTTTSSLHPRSFAIPPSLICRSTSWSTTKRDTPWRVNASRSRSSTSSGSAITSHESCTRGDCATHRVDRAAGMCRVSVCRGVSGRVHEGVTQAARATRRRRSCERSARANAPARCRGTRTDRSGRRCR